MNLTRYAHATGKRKLVNKTLNSFPMVGRCQGVSVAFRKIVNPDSRELYTTREWRDFSGTDLTGLPCQLLWPEETGYYSIRRHTIVDHFVLFRSGIVLTGLSVFWPIEGWSQLLWRVKRPTGYETAYHAVHWIICVRGLEVGITF